MSTKTYDYIDSSVDAQEGWSKFGADPDGVMPMLQEGVGSLGALASEPQGFRLFTAMDQRQILDEIRENPEFGKRLQRMLHNRLGPEMISRSAKRAALNELDPGSARESKGEWITLRRRIREIVRSVDHAINRGTRGLSLAQKTALLRRIADGGGIDLQLGAEAPATATTGSGDIWGGIASAIANVATGIYGAKIASDTQKDIAKIQSRTATQQAAYQGQIAQAQAALDAARLQQGIVPGGATSGGIPTWAYAVGIAAILGFGIYMMTKR